MLSFVTCLIVFKEPLYSITKKNARTLGLKGSLAFNITKIYMLRLNGLKFKYIKIKWK